MTSIESEDLSNRPSLISLKKTKLKTFERRNASKPSIAAGELKRFEDVEDDTEEGEEEIVVALGSKDGRVTLLSYYNLIKLDKLIFKDRFEFDLKPLLNSSNNCSDKNSNVSIPRRRSNTSAKIHGLEICPNSINQRDSKRTSGLTRTNFKLIFCTSDHEIGIYRFDLKFVERWLLKLHRSAINDLISWKEEDGKDQTIRLITGSSTEVVLWDLTTEPICLGCFGRRMVPRNPYSPLMVRLETINNLCEQPRKLIAEFEDHSIASWDLRDIIPQHHHQQQQQQQVKKLRTTQPEVISGDRSKTGWAFSCCDDMAHRYQIDSEGTIRNLDSQADLANLLEPVELFVCLNCNHQTDEVDFLVLKRRTGEILTVRTKLSKKIGNSDEERFTIKLVKSNCSWFKFCKTEKILITKSSGKNELSLITKEQLILFDVNKSRSNSSGLMRRNSRIESRFHDEDMKESCGSIKSLTLDMIQGNQSDDYYTKVNDNQLLIILKDQLNKNFSFHPKLRLPIYKRILSIASSNKNFKSPVVYRDEEEGVDDSRLVNEYFNGLSKPNPTEFLKKFRFEWKLEEPKFQFSLETLLTIFRGTKRYTDDLLIDRLSPILYSFLNIFQSAPTEQRSKRQQATPYESYHQEVDLTNINDDGDDETELEIYIVCNKLLNNENGRIFLEEDRWKAFVEDIERCLLDEPSGRKILKLFDDLKISFGKDVLYSLTYGFFMGFTTPKTFACLMDHLILDLKNDERLIDRFCYRLILNFKDEILNCKNRNQILRFCSESHEIPIKELKEILSKT